MFDGVCYLVDIGDDEINIVGSVLDVVVNFLLVLVVFGGGYVQWFYGIYGIVVFDVDGIDSCWFEQNLMDFVYNNFFWLVLLMVY